MSQIKVLLADDHRMIREGLRSLLNSEDDMQVVGEASDGQSAVTMANTLLPDVIVMDFHMPGLNGVEATRKAIGEREGLKVICLSAHSTEQAVAQMIRAGAAGFVVKEAAFEELAIAIRTAIAGKIYLSPQIASTLVSEYIRGGALPGGMSIDTLSPREREIVQLIAEGNATKQIAMKLQVSVKTVETHRRNLMEKLQIDTVAGITKYAIRNGMTTA